MDPAHASPPSLQGPPYKFQLAARAQPTLPGYARWLTNKGCWTAAQIVVLSQVLACDATLGYEEMHNTKVLRFNGTKIRNLAHLAELTTTCTQPFMRFDLDLDVRAPHTAVAQNLFCQRHPALAPLDQQHLDTHAGAHMHSRWGACADQACSFSWD